MNRIEKRVRVMVDGRVIDLGPSRLFEEGRDTTRAIDVDADLVLHLGTGRPLAPICCKICDQVFRPIDIEVQIREFLRSRYYERRLDAALQAELVTAIAPWFDRFRAGEDLCFDCGVTPAA